MNERVIQLLRDTHDRVLKEIRIAREGMDDLKKLEKLARQLIKGLPAHGTKPMGTRVMSPEAKQRIIAAQKKRWAAYRRDKAKGEKHEKTHTNGKHNNPRFDTSKIGKKPSSFHEAVTIAMKNRAMSPPEILDAVHATGYEFSAKNPMGSIQSQLNQGRGKRYGRKPNGKWIIKAGAKNVLVN